MIAKHCYGGVFEMWPVIDRLMDGLKVCETEVTTWNGHHSNTLPCAYHIVQTQLVFIYHGYILFSTPTHFITSTLYLNNGLRQE